MSERRHTTRICFFDVGLDEMPMNEQADDIAVGRAIAKAGRFSVFDATANETIANTMDRLTVSGWFVFENAGYPWTKVTPTDAGRAALGMQNEDGGANG